MLKTNVPSNGTVTVFRIKKNQLFFSYFSCLDDFEWLLYFDLSVPSMILIYERLHISYILE